MQRFPDTVRRAMTQSGASATCVPVQMSATTDQQAASQGDWESAVFFQVAGPESKEDRRVLRKDETRLPLGLETDLINHDNACVVLLRFSITTRPDDPLVAEVLLTPGLGGTHFQSLQLLSMQGRLVWFFGDQGFQVISTQQMTLGPQHHQHFEELLTDANAHDAMVRMTSNYDSQRALSDVVANYEMRMAVDQPEYQGNKPDRGNVS